MPINKSSCPRSVQRLLKRKRKEESFFTQNIYCPETRNCVDIFLVFQASPNEKREHLYKVLVIGELGTGKTSIIKRYVHQFFSQHYRATVSLNLPRNHNTLRRCLLSKLNDI